MLSREALNRALRGEPSFDVSEKVTQEFFERGIKAPLLKTFDEETNPRLRQAFAGLGSTFSTRRGEAVRRELGNLNQQLTGELSRFQFQTQNLRASLAESAANRQLGAIGLAEQFEQFPLQRSQALRLASDPFQARAQQERELEIQEFLRTRDPLSGQAFQSALGFTGQRQQENIIQPGTPNTLLPAIAFGVGTLFSGGNIAVGGAASAATSAAIA